MRLGFSHFGTVTRHWTRPPGIPLSLIRCRWPWSLGVQSPDPSSCQLCLSRGHVPCFCLDMKSVFPALLALTLVSLSASLQGDHVCWRNVRSETVSTSGSRCVVSSAKWHLAMCCVACTAACTAAVVSYSRLPLSTRRPLLQCVF